MLPSQKQATTMIIYSTSIPLQTMVIIYLLCVQVTSKYIYEDCVDNLGKEYIFVFLENQRQGMEPQLFISTPLTIDVTVRIRTPAWVSPDRVDMTVVVDNKNATIVYLPETVRLKDPIKDKKGILVTSSDVITLFMGNIQDNSGDSSIVYPTDAIGKEYIDVIYNQTSTTYTSTLGVTAIADNTTVTLSVPPAVSAKFEGETYSETDFQILLNQYETFQVEAHDLSGTTLTANNQIAVHSGYTFIRIGSSTTKDYLETMLPPLSSLSTKYLLVNNPLHTKSEHVRVVNPYPQTKVSFISASSGNQEVTLTTKGSFTNFLVPMVGGAMITADKPVLVAQLSTGRSMGSKGDPRIMMAFSENSLLTEYSFVTPALIGSKVYIHGVIIVCESGKTDTLTLDESKVTDLGASWVVLDASGYSYTHLPIPFGAHTLKSDNLGTKFGGFVFGYGSAEEYGTEIGRYFQNINQTTSTEYDSLTYRETRFSQLYENHIPNTSPIHSQTLSSRTKCLVLCLSNEKCQYTAVKVEDEENVRCLMFGPSAACSQLTFVEGYDFYKFTKVNVNNG